MKNKNNSSLRTPNSALSQIRVAVCGELPTVCEYLIKQGVIHIDKYTDAVEIRRESDYHLILVYAPQAEGMLGTFYQMKDKVVPIRMLNEPCCHGILSEIKMTVQDLARTLSGSGTEVASDG